MKLQLLFLFSVFLMPGCITKMITRLPPEKAAEVVRYMDEAEKHYQATARDYEALDKLYEELFINVDKQYNRRLLRLDTGTKILKAGVKKEEIKKQVKKFNKIREQQQQDFLEIEKVVNLLKGHMDIVYDKAVRAHGEAKKHADLYWWDEKAENHRNKKWSYFTQARRYENQAEKHLDYASHASQKIQKSFNVEVFIIREEYYLKYFHQMKQMFQSYREAIKHGILEIKYRRIELEKIREVRI